MQAKDADQARAEAERALALDPSSSRGEAAPRHAKIALNLTAHTQDDGFHEIQLNGKQLVFLFMAATVVSVVIFLCGVLVGRGVRAERSADADAAGLSAAAEPTPQAPAPGATPTPAGSDPTAAAAPPTVDDLSYFDRLQASNPSPEQLKAPEQPAAAPPAAAPAAAPRAATPPPAAPASAPARAGCGRSEQRAAGDRATRSRLPR